MRLSRALLAASLAATTALADAPPMVVFVPLANALYVAKHPSLPVLYVACNDSPESRNLVTFRLNPDGSLIPDSKRVCDDYISTDGKTPSFRHNLKRPAVNAEKGVLYLAAYPVTANSVTTYSNTNNFEFTAVALDEKGQPAKRLRLFRNEVTGTQGLGEIGFNPHFARLWFAYYSSFCWLDLGADGLPVSIQTKYLQQFWRWTYVPDWQRFYVTRPDSTLSIVQLAADGETMSFLQNVAVNVGDAGVGDVAVSVRHRKAYVLSTAKGRELTVYQLSSEGRLVGLPRSFALGQSGFLRCDFKAMALHALGPDGLKTLKLGDDGLPVGALQVHPLNCGYLYDVFLDGATGKLYVACAKPPNLAPPAP